MERGGDVPGQEFFDAADWMLSDRCLDSAQVEVRVPSAFNGMRTGRNSVGGLKVCRAFQTRFPECVLKLC